MAYAVTFPTAVTLPTAEATPGPLRPSSGPWTQPRPARPPVRLTRRGRAVLALAVGLVALVVVGLGGSFVAEAGPAAADLGPATTVVVVQPGESLWQIAQQLAPDADPRLVVTAIRELNGIGVAPIVPGQPLIVPVFDAP